MEAPEKIYLQENTTTDCYGEFWAEWFEARVKDTDIEYTRTDAFIEKAADKLKQLMYEQHLFEGRIHRNAVIENFVEWFKNYMKGE